jgi:allantoicase
MFFSSPEQLLLPGRARTMADGWENARRRDDGNDHVTVRLAARGHVRRVEVDTSYFVGNTPGWASLRGIDARGSDLEDGAWFDLVPKTRLQPDTRHYFRAVSADAATHVRLDVYPDGGLARLRVNGEIDDAAREAAVLRWLDLLPTDHAVRLLVDEGGLPGQDADELAGRRPFSGTNALPPSVLDRFLG